jgi:halimadienyl-diphosphate synthase
LRAALRGSGVSLSPSFPIPDADNTAVALILMSELGEEVDPRVLQAFARPDGHFASFPHERHSSVGVNLHVLHAVLRSPSFPDRARVIGRLLDYLADHQVAKMYWYDKWHISPYYATAHAIRVLAELPPDERCRMAPMIERAREWLCHTQTSDGYWGFYGEPTAEETAYAVLALTSPSGYADETDDWNRCVAADHYLRSALDAGASGDSAAYPILWIDKCLYAPNLIIRAAITAARHAIRQANARVY